MTKDQLAAELKAKVKPGIKPSHLRKSKSLSDIPVAPPLPPLQKSKSQLEIPVNQPSPEQQISQLHDQLKFQAQISQNYLKNLQLAQVKITELEAELQAQESFVEAPEENPAELKAQIQQLEQQILQLRLEKITEFGYFLEKKQELKTELELNITAGISEINRLESKLLATNKKKLELAHKLSESQTKNTKLELKLLDKQAPETNPSFNYWPLIIVLGLYCCSAWLLSKNNTQ